MTSITLTPARTTAGPAAHLTDDDITLLGDSGTTISMCCTTERDLADGVGPAVRLSAAGSPLALRVLFGSSYEASGRPMAVLLVALACTVAATLLHPSLMVLRKWWAIGIAAALGLLVNTSLDIVLLGYVRTGIIGPSFATLAATGVLWIVYETAVRSDLRLATDVAAPLLGVSAVGAACAVLLSPVMAAAVGVPAVTGLALALWAVKVRR